MTDEPEEERPEPDRTLPYPNVSPSCSVNDCMFCEWHNCNHHCHNIERGRE